MAAINLALASDVKEFLDSGDRAFLTHLLMSPRDDIECQAVVRYLMQLKHWPMTPDSDFSKALEHLFGDYPERPKRDAAEYQQLTKDMIQQAFGYECVTIVPEAKPAVEAKPNPGKRTSKPRMQSEAESLEEGESGSRTFKSIRESEADT